MKIRTLFAFALTVGLLAQPLYAHRFWIITSGTVLSGEAPWVTIDAAISNTLFFPDHVAPALEMFTVTGPDGKEVAVQNGSKGKYRTTFDIELAKPGTYKIANARETVSASWQENGEQQRFRGTQAEFDAAGIKDKPGVQVSHSASRLETFVTSGEPSLTALEPTGQGLEISFQKTHPNDLFSGEKVAFVLLKDGKPASGVEVTIIKGDDRYRTEPGELKVTTAEDGTFEFNFPEAGRYWLNASALPEGAPAPSSTGGGPGRGGARYSYTATFEVLPQ